MVEDMETPRVPLMQIRLSSRRSKPDLNALSSLGISEVSEGKTQADDELEDSILPLISAVAKHNESDDSRTGTTPPRSLPPTTPSMRNKKSPGNIRGFFRDVGDDFDTPPASTPKGCGPNKMWGEKKFDFGEGKRNSSIEDNAFDLTR